MKRTKPQEVEHYQHRLADIRYSGDSRRDPPERQGYDLHPGAWRERCMAVDDEWDRYYREGGPHPIFGDEDETFSKGEK